ncbi:MAG: hypothetical protein HY211_03235 [Candidatus Omnitrophica bacterium]|nr:hypothetical protein [Candidatus Omnitrophota bacterium]
MKKPSVGTIVLFVALILSTLSAVNFALGRNAERTKRIWLEGQLDKITKARDALQEERDELVKTKESLEGQLKDTMSQAKDLAQQFAQEKKARESLTTELAQTRRDLTDRNEQVSNTEKEKENLTEDLAKAKQSYQALSNELTTLRQAKEALERRVKEMLSLQAQEAEKIVVKPTRSTNTDLIPAPSQSSSPLEGKVLVVNRDFNFVVVNLGSKEGLKIGDQLSLWRGGKAIGKAQVEKLYETMSAATLLTEEKKGQVKEGDLVRLTS